MKPPFRFWALLWGLGSVVAAVSIGEDIFTRHAGRAIGRDFTNEWVAGRLALDHQTWCAFFPDCFRVEMYSRIDVLNHQNFSYPPHTLFMDIPFAIPGYYVGLALWTIFGAAFFYCAARPFLPSGFRPMWSLLTPAALINVWNGHYGFVLGGLWLLCFYNLKRKPLAAGVYAGLLTFKPHLGLMIAVATLTKWRAAAAAVGTTIILVLASAAVFGPGAWFDFINTTVAEQTDILTDPSGAFYFRMMASAYVAYGQGSLAIRIQIVLAGAALFLIARSRTVDAFSFATATFLIVPYSFNYDMTVVSLGAAILIWDRWSVLSWLERAALAGAFLSPELTYFVQPLVPEVLLLALWTQTQYLRSLQPADRSDDHDNFVISGRGGAEVERAGVCTAAGNRL